MPTDTLTPRTTPPLAQPTLVGPILASVVARLLSNLDGDLGDDDGFSTAELLGNAALAIAALVVIWGGMQTLGLDVVAWMRNQLLGG